MAVKITRIEKDSLAEKFNIRPGEKLVSINGQEINDMLDLQYYQTNANVSLVMEDIQGIQRTIEITNKEEYRPLGLEFETYLIDKHHYCKNKCIFCFIDQLPKGMRKSLYFKDDDERLSFLFGNYITMTNLSQKEIDRIKRIKISPINISVHTTNPQLRVQMMKNPKAAEINQRMEEFAQAGIKMNCQIVLCKGVNDGKELANTIKDLQKLYPAVQSVSIVPIGLTKYRDGLEKAQTFNGNECGEIIDLVNNATQEFYNKKGTRLIYLSDEFYLKSQREIPKADYYEDFPQIENGVGMVRTFIDNFENEIEYLTSPSKEVAVDIATGESFYPVLKGLAKKAQNKLGQNLNINVHMIKNHFFGGNVSVTGLLTGQDIVKQLGGNLSTKRLVLCKDMLRSEGDLFLDDMTPKQVEDSLDTKIEFYENDGFDLLSGILKEV